MKRLKGIALALVLAGLCLGTALPALASSRYGERNDVYWTARSVERLLSEDFLDSLRLTARQREAIRDLARDERFARRSGKIEDLRDIVGLAFSGERVSTERRGALERDLDYLLRTDDDFLDRFYQVLDPGQRRKVWEQVNRWYDDNGNRGWHFGRARTGLSRDLERRLQLSKPQKREIDRILRDAEKEMREREKRLLRMEQDAFRRSWSPAPTRSANAFRRELLDARGGILFYPRGVSERIRSVLDPRQRRVFDSWRGGIFER